MIRAAMKMSQALFGLLGLLPLSIRAADMPRYLFYDDLPLDFQPDAWERNLEKDVRRWKAAMTEEGVRPFFSYWGDFLANPVGGRSQEASWMQLLVVGGEVSLEKWLEWRGGSVVVSFTDAAGSNLSLPVGNVFTISQAYVMNSFALYDLYFKQRLLDGGIEVDIGRFSAGQFFATMPAMGMVVSGAVNGNPTSLFLNAPYHATASASWAAHAKVKPTEQTYAEAGIFQASPRIGNPAYHGADFSIRPGDGVLLMAEAGWTPDFGADPVTSDGKGTARRGRKGVYSFGAYSANYSFETFAGGTARQAYGFYAMAQQMVWRSPANERHHFSLWGGVTWSPQEELALMPVMGFGGAIWQGLVPTRDQDNLLLSFYMGNFSRDYANAQAEAGNGRPTLETVIEASYIIQLTESLQLQPDLQWIIQPGGTGDIPNALVLGFQAGLTF
jgi:porin